MLGGCWNAGWKIETREEEEEEEEGKGEEDEEEEAEWRKVEESRCTFTWKDERERD